MNSSTDNNKQVSSLPLYAVIDLGSNSFHLLVTRLLVDSVQVVDKVKRKVRLASGLNQDNILDESAIARGLECLRFFAECIQDIPPQNIRIVATATLRIANNAEEFLQKAQTILGQKVTVLSGEQEAKQIYLGVAHTSCSCDDRFVVDIGGASTELIVGNGFNANKVTSLNIGCVTLKKQCFLHDEISLDAFNLASALVKEQLAPLVEDYKKIGWQVVLGGSGTMQALAEILHAQQKPAIITLDFLYEIKQQLLTFKQFNDIKINGLSTERIPVFASGFSIILSIFESFNIDSLQLSSGALREGLLYEMLPSMRMVNIRQRTLASLTERFHIDQSHAQRITHRVNDLFEQLTPMMSLRKGVGYNVLIASCALLEVGLLLEYKSHQRHGAYIIKNADLPGFNQEEKQLLAVFVQYYKGDININTLKEQTAVDYQTVCNLLIILRLAVILSHRQQNEVSTDYQVKYASNTIEILLTSPWLLSHPLIVDEIKQENLHGQQIGFSLAIKEI